MALKGDREVLATDIDMKIESGKDAERGIILIGTTTAGEAAVPSTTSLTVTGNEKPVGLLLDDVEDLDYTTRPQILSRNVVPRASEISLLVKGWVKTNLIKKSANAPREGRPAYLEASGWVSADPHVAGSGIKVGFFQSTKDSDGYARLFVDIHGGNI